MIFENSRLGRALRVAFYPVFEPAEAKRFEALTKEARNARNSGDLTRAEHGYLRAMAEVRSWSDPSYLNYVRNGLAQVYQDQKRYQEAEVILREQLEEALKSPQPNTLVHAAHMGLARLYVDQEKLTQAEEHYKAALAETERGGAETGRRGDTEIRSASPRLPVPPSSPWPDRQVYCSTALWLARFYVEQHRYSDAESLFERVVEIWEANHPSDASLPHYLQELAKIYEAQEKFASAEELYRRALKICEEMDQPKDLLIVRAVDDLARFYKARGRFAEAEEFSRKGLAIVEEKIRRHSAADIKRFQRRPNDKNLEATIKRARVPISEALDRLADIYEAQEKYAEAEPVRRRSIEIKQQAWGEHNDFIWVDALVAHANSLHKIGREDEATQLDERVQAIRTQQPQRRTRVTLTSRPIQRTLRWRFWVFIHALLRPAPR